MSKKLAKKRQPVKPVVAKEPARTAKNFGYEEMLSELEAIVADAETRLVEDEATALRQVAGCGENALSGTIPKTWRLSGLARHNLDNLPIGLLHRMAC